ncbi:MAG: LCP family protein [Anaerolineales bacterium]
MRKAWAGFTRFVRSYRRLSVTAIVLFLLVAVVAIPTAYSWAHYAGTAPTGLFGFPLFATPEGGLNAQEIQQSGQGFVLPEAWSGSDRVTILVMGLDYRDWSEGQGPSRTDSMMLLSVDPVTKTAGILSIPRDLWVVIPGFTPNKINTAYYFGELYKVPGGGPELARRTVEQTIGVPIDYYAQIDFNAFIWFIDLIGGVKIEIPAPITVDPLGADTIPKNLKPGVFVLPGDIALAYARERHAEGGDFARAQRQQQVVLAVRERILDLNLLPGLVANANEIYAQLSAGVQTNLSLEDAIRLAVLATQIKKEDIRQGLIGERDVIYGRSPDDLAILIPVPDRIHEIRNEVFGSGTALGPHTPGSAEQKLAAEAARISIQNGTADSGLGTRAQSFLANLGANIVDNRPAGGGLGQTVLVDHTGNPYTLAYLAQLLGIPSARIIHEFDPASPIDVELRLGSDAASAFQ